MEVFTLYRWKSIFIKKKWISIEKNVFQTRHSCFDFKKCYILRWDFDDFRMSFCLIERVIYHRFRVSGSQCNMDTNQVCYPPIFAVKIKKSLGVENNHGGSLPHLIYERCFQVKSGWNGLISRRFASGIQLSNHFGQTPDGTIKTFRKRCLVCPRLA